MSNANVTILDDIIEEKKRKKKKAANVQENQQYRTAWTALITNDGFTNQVEKYLYEGVFFCGAEPFAAYLHQTNSPSEVLKSFFGGKMYTADKSATFRLLSHLFALLINDNPPQQLIASIIMRFPAASLNKDKKRLGTAEKTMEKYFFAELNPDAELFPLEELGLKTVFIDEFVQTMKSIIDGIKESGFSNSVCMSNIAKVELWISAYPTTSEKCTTNNSASEKNEVPSKAAAVQEQRKSLEINDSPRNTTSNKEIRDNRTFADQNAHLLYLLDQVQQTVSSINSENAQRKRNFLELSRTLSIEKEKLHHASQQLADQLETIVDLRQKLSVAEKDNDCLKEMVAQKDLYIAEKETEIAERTKLSDMLSRDKSKQVDEALQRMASKIGVEYRDFQDALAAPMSCDLGENLRLQLKNVFEILEKGGMKFK